MPQARRDRAEGALGCVGLPCGVVAPADHGGIGAQPARMPQARRDRGVPRRRRGNPDRRIRRRRRRGVGNRPRIGDGPNIVSGARRVAAGEVVVQNVRPGARNRQHDDRDRDDHPPQRRRRAANRRGLAVSAIARRGGRPRGPARSGQRRHHPPAARLIERRQPVSRRGLARTPRRKNAPLLTRKPLGTHHPARTEIPRTIDVTRPAKGMYPSPVDGPASRARAGIRGHWIRFGTLLWRLG